MNKPKTVTMSQQTSVKKQREKTLNAREKLGIVPQNPEIPP